MFWILSLSEKHATINGHWKTDDSIDIIVIEDGGNILPILCLQKEDVLQWKMALANV